jgi:uncharacterized protein YoxC
MRSIPYTIKENIFETIGWIIAIVYVIVMIFVIILVEATTSMIDKIKRRYESWEYGEA